MRFPLWLTIELLIVGFFVFGWILWYRRHRHDKSS